MLPALEEYDDSISFLSSSFKLSVEDSDFMLDPRLDLYLAVESQTSSITDAESCDVKRSYDSIHAVSEDKGEGGRPASSAVKSEKSASFEHYQSQSSFMHTAPVIVHPFKSQSKVPAYEPSLEFIGPGYLNEEDTDCDSSMPGSPRFTLTDSYDCSITSERFFHSRSGSAESLHTNVSLKKKRGGKRAGSGYCATKKKKKRYVHCNDKKKRYDFDSKKEKFAALLVRYQSLLIKTRRLDVDGVFSSKVRYLLEAFFVAGADDVHDLINDNSLVNVSAPCVWASGELDARGPKNFAFLKHLFAMALQLLLKRDSLAGWTVAVDVVEAAEGESFTARFCCEQVGGLGQACSLVKLSGLTCCSFSEGFIHQASISFGTSSEAEIIL